jgi:hypothetical protein
MLRHNEGLTSIYNRYHDPEERDPGIFRLRELHAQMDRAVLAAYGWSDIARDCMFVLDYEVDDELSDRLKPYRYRWPDEVRDEILGRLLDLNTERARVDTQTDVDASLSTQNRRKGHRTKEPSKTKDLFS